MGKVNKSKRIKEPSAPDKCPKAWEKARRDRMKVLFEELSRLLPKFDPAVPPSRPEIIQKAMALIRDLQAQNEDLLNGGFDEVYRKKLDMWKLRVKELLTRVEQLSGILRTANIHVPPLGLEAVPSWTTSRPKHWTEKVNIAGDKVEQVIKQLAQAKKTNNKEVKAKKLGKRKKKSVEPVIEAQSKENQPTVVALIKEKGAASSKKAKIAPLILPQPPSIPVSIQSRPPQQTTVAHVQNLVQNTSVSQAGTYILTNQGNLFPVLTPSASVLTPVIINRPPPLLVLQTPPQAPHPFPVILSRPPANKRRIDRESTVMTFANKRPIPALSKHSHPRRGGKCVAHKTAVTTNLLTPAASSNVPVVSPTAAFLNSFPVVSTPKVAGGDDDEATPENVLPDAVPSGSLDMSFETVKEEQAKVLPSCEQMDVIHTISQEVITPLKLPATTAVDTGMKLPNDTKEGVHSSLNKMSSIVNTIANSDKSTILSSESPPEQKNPPPKSVGCQTSSVERNKIVSSAPDFALLAGTVLSSTPQTGTLLSSSSASKVKLQTATVVTSDSHAVALSRAPAPEPNLQEEQLIKPGAVQLTPKTEVNTVKLPTPSPLVAAQPACNEEQIKTVSAPFNLPPLSQNIHAAQPAQMSAKCISVASKGIISSAIPYGKPITSSIPVILHGTPVSISSPLAISNGTPTLSPIISVIPHLTPVSSVAPHRSTISSSNTVPHLPTSNLVSSIIPHSNPIPSSIYTNNPNENSTLISFASIIPHGTPISSSTSSIIPRDTPASSSIPYVIPCGTHVPNSSSSVVSLGTPTPHSISAVTPHKAPIPCSILSAIPPRNTIQSSTSSVIPQKTPAPASVSSFIPPTLSSINSIAPHRTAVPTSATPLIPSVSSSINAAALHRTPVPTSSSSLIPPIPCLMNSAASHETPAPISASSLIPPIPSSINSAVPHTTPVSSSILSGIPYQAPISSSSFILQSNSISISNTAHLTHAPSSICSVISHETPAPSSTVIPHGAPAPSYISSVPLSNVVSAQVRSWQMPEPQTNKSYGLEKLTSTGPSKSPDQFYFPSPAPPWSPVSKQPSTQGLKPRSYTESIGLTVGRSDFPPAGAMTFPSSWAPVPIISKVAPARIASSSLTPLLPPVATTSQGTWLPMPSLYNETFNKSTPTTTWRPISADPVWSDSQPIEPWKMTPTHPHSKLTTPYEAVPNPAETSTAATHVAASAYLPPHSVELPNPKASVYLPPHSAEPIPPKPKVPTCETTWSSGISRTSTFTSNVPNRTTKMPVDNTYNAPAPPNDQSVHTFDYKANVHPVQLSDNPWNTSQQFQALPSQKVHQSSYPVPKPPNVASNANYLKSVSGSNTVRTSYVSSSGKSNYVDSRSATKSHSLQLPSTMTINPQQSFKLDGSIVPTCGGNYSLPNAGLCNPFGMNAYAPPLLKTSMSENSYSSNFVSTFGNEASYAPKPFALDVSKALFNEPPYSLAVPKAPVSESYFTNVPIYQSVTSNVLPTQTTYSSSLSASKPLLLGESGLSSSVQSSDRTEGSSARSKTSERAQKETPLLPPTSTSIKHHSNMFSEQKMQSSISYSASVVPVDQGRSNNSKQTVSDVSTSLWNAPYFTQTGNATSDAGASWGQLDYACTGESKDNRPKPPINWMTEPEQRSDGLCHADDPFQPRYQTVPPSHNILDFCFNPADEESTRSKSRKKDMEGSSQDYFGWISMKVDPLVVPSTLPTLVGDLALGSDPVPAKRCKTNQECYSRSGKNADSTHHPQEPFTNLAKNIFDISQSESSKSGNLTETIVLKNIFELPAVASGKQRPNQGQNSFLSVSQLVEPHNMDMHAHKSDYTYYNQRAGKGKRSSGWKCGEKKCQQSGKSYSAESLLRSSDAHDFPHPSSTVFPLDFPHDHGLVATPDNDMGQQGKPKTYSSRPRKQDYWRGQEFKGPNEPSFPTPPKNSKKPEVPFSFANMADARLNHPQPNLHAATGAGVPSALPYPRFPTNPSAPLLGHGFPQSKDAFPPSPGRPCGPTDSNYVARYPGPRKPYPYARPPSKNSYPYVPDNRKPIGKSSANIQQSPNASLAVGGLYSKCTGSIQQSPNPLSPSYPPKSAANLQHSVLSSPLSTGVAYSKSSVTMQQSPNPALGSPLSMGTTYLPKTTPAIQQTINSAVGSPLASGGQYHPAKSLPNIQQSPNPSLASPLPPPTKASGKVLQSLNIAASPLSIGASYLPKPGGTGQPGKTVLGSPLPLGTSYLPKPGGTGQPGNTVLGSPLLIGTSYLPKPGGTGQPGNTVLGSPLPIGASYPPFPPLPPHTPGSSGSSLANFNLTTIFPEMNKKGYQYT